MWEWFNRPDNRSEPEVVGANDATLEARRIAAFALAHSWVEPSTGSAELRAPCFGALP